MTIVVDASVAAKWFIKEAGREQALKALDDPERHAPDLIVAEIANIARKKAIRVRSPTIRRTSFVRQ